MGLGLPVIATCGECGWCAPSFSRGRASVCRKGAGVAVERDTAPPSECPLRPAAEPVQPSTPLLFDIVEGGYVHYTRPAGDPMLEEARALRGYSVHPHPWKPDLVTEPSAPLVDRSYAIRVATLARSEPDLPIESVLFQAHVRTT